MTQNTHTTHHTSHTSHTQALIPTGLTFEIPLDHYGRIAPRSSVAWKNHIDVGAGVIDAGTRMERVWGIWCGVDGGW